MTGTQVKVSEPAQRWRKIGRRTLGVLVTAALMVFLLRHLSVVLDRSRSPAGFLRGMLQGAMMPCALPNLLIGNDVTIYAQNNTGLTYKLGYTFGVNLCGAFFFGMLFWRLSRWRKRANGKVD